MGTEEVFKFSIEMRLKHALSLIVC